MKQEIILIRGLPGSGKSTIARQMLGYVHLEADMFFDVNGLYSYDASKVSQAHDWCVTSAKTALEAGESVVVSNTFIKLWELERYIKIGFPFKIIEANGAWPNVHGVPQEKIEIMKKRWDSLPEEWR